ncbi:hypothetical protein GCM10012287_29200 [Streptomyces daqingensis]|uniref:YoaR-like putative peptidoglycan binding domain-containing protein n=1 Tax=Streptomyces daqingensis TaxID=1472640 RepID=A0ABQ2MHI2_9ACTN|nr:hypothetical protein [Streptomyces daqingensis]GGO50132.1 hypothetical protein GCM10012287_29200 [Streptomyces daqingensis]
MSRETDRSSSGPEGQGRGPYPRGAEPYGSGAAGNSADPAGAAGAGPNAGAKGRSGDSKTEKTLTTRIRIKIPGSRPIPPVVVRKTVNDDEAGATPDDGAPGPIAPGDAPSSPLPGPRAASGAPAPGGPGEGPGGGEFTQETSDWFAPRKGKAGSGGSASPGGSGAPRPGGPQGGPPGAGIPPGAEPLYGTHDPYGGGNPYGVSELYAPNADPYDTGSHSLPGSGTPAHGTPSIRQEGFERTQGGAPRPLGPDGPVPGPGPAPTADGAAGPTTGPARGDMPLPPRPDGAPGPAEGPAGSTLGLGAGPAPFATGGVGEHLLPDAFRGPAPSATPDALRGPAPSGAPEAEPVAGGTLMGRAPRTPAEGSSPPAAPQFPGAADGSDDFDDETSSGGRSKLVLAGVGIFGLVAVAYGAGLLLDHADVPNGTTVLGVDIGGTSRHEAVNKLDAAFGNRTTQPFRVEANGQRAELKPSVAGLTLDTEATVREAAGRDYNPVTVIGSLFGAGREAQPALKVDKEKMESALQTVSKQTGGGGAPKDGAVKFVRGKAVAVPGKPYKGIDPEKASSALEKAYRDRAATGDNSPVRLPVSLQQPRIGKAELKRAIEQFGEPAMSGLVTIKAGNASIQFSPEKSLPKFLSMKPVNGTLVDTYDLPVLQDLYGTTFEGVQITRGDGSKSPVTPQDVAGELRLALKETSPKKRIREIPLNRN